LQVNEPKPVFLPKIGVSQSNHFNETTGKGNREQKSEVFVVPIEAYPKMNLTKGGYLPKMIGNQRD
jgi:hypothetical protein